MIRSGQMVSINFSKEEKSFSFHFTVSKNGFESIVLSAPSVSLFVCVSVK